MTDLAEPIPGVPLGRHPRPTVGYALALGAAALFAINGTVSKSILLTGIEPTRLSQLRVSAAFVVLLVFVAIARPSALKIKRNEIGLLLAYGILGVAMTQYLYFVSIRLLPIGVSLLFEYTAPIIVALWFRFALHQRTRGTMWLGLVVAMVGLALVGQVWEGFALDGLGVLAGFGAAAALATYFLLGDRQMRQPDPRDAVSLTLWGFGAAALFWAIVQPWWSFPWSSLSGTGHPMGDGHPAIPIWALACSMVILGTVVPFWMEVAALTNIRASQVSVVAMTEPLVAIAVAWLALGEVLSGIQLVGAVVVLAGVIITERSR